MASRCDEEWLGSWKNVPVYVIQATAYELFPFAKTEKTVSKLVNKDVKVKFIKVENTSYAESRKFIVPLQYSYKWLSELNLQ